MKKHLGAFILSLVLAVGLIPGLALAAAGGDSATGDAKTSKILAEEADKTPKVTVVRAASGKLAMQAGKTYKLGAKTTVGKLSYKSSDKKVATVSSEGIVKAKRVGKATITVNAKSGSKKDAEKVIVTVLSAKEFTNVKKVKAEASLTNLEVGMTTEMDVTFSPSKSSNKNVVFESSNPKVLTVGAKGKVKALKAGKAKITVTSCDNAKAKDSVAITVTPSYPLNRSKWEARMHLPTNKQISGYKAADRSPYLVCWPKFDGVAGYTGYAVDFKADSQPRGTYVNIGNWWMDVSSLKKSYKAIETDDGDDPGGMYAGFQVLEDGRKVAIMSVWRMFLTDKNGKKSVFDAKRTYPKKPRIADDFGGEGTGVKTIVDYDWQAGKTYRALIQFGKTNKGNCELTFSVCDLETGKWTKLISYDLGYGDTQILKLGCFLENYFVDYAARVRTAEWSNFRAKSSKTGSWVSAKTATMERQFPSWKGSYNYGSDDSCFWAITSGVPGLCNNPAANGKKFSVSKAEEGNPK